MDNLNREIRINYLTTQKLYFADNYGIEKIGLIGSIARNENTEESDIDFVYHLKETSKLTYFQLFELEQTLKNHFNKKIELINYKYINPIIKFTSEKDLIYV
jgi:predicted nucleotidyltransferase